MVRKASCRQNTLRPVARRRVSLAMLSAATVLSGACATIVHGGLGVGRSQQTVLVESTPAGAHVLRAGVLVGLTPTRLTVPRSDRHVTLRIEKEGYKPEEILLTTKVSGWIAADAATGVAQFANQGLSSQAEQARAALIVPAMLLGVDFLTGGAFVHPSRIQITLEPSAGLGGR